MRLTDFSDYSMRVLIHLNQTQELVTLNELANYLKLSKNHLIKISNKLVKLGYVEATRGRSGGLRIKNETGKTPLGSIILSTEERIYLAECFSGGKIQCVLQKNCVLKVSLHEAFDAFIASLNQRTLNDITPGR